MRDIIISRSSQNDGVPVAIWGTPVVTGNRVVMVLGETCVQGADGSRRVFLLLGNRHSEQVPFRIGGQIRHMVEVVGLGCGGPRLFDISWNTVRAAVAMSNNAKSVTAVGPEDFILRKAFPLLCSIVLVASSFLNKSRAIMQGKVKQRMKSRSRLKICSSNPI